MKKIILILSWTLLLGTMACDNSTKKEADTSIKNLNTYIDSVKTTKPEYTTSYWVVVEKNYQKRLAKAEALPMDENQKKALEKSKADYQDLKIKYDAEVQKNYTDSVNSISNKKQLVRNALFGDKKIGEDLNFSWVTAANIKSVYENFVATVDANKKTYSRDEWDEVKFLYENLDTRKNEVEKDLSSKDNMKIAKEKIRFSSIESVYRPLAKMKENAEAKK